MTSRTEFDRAIAAARTEADRILALSALLSSATGDDLIVVGGSAIYLHAPEQTPSLDVDVVTRARPLAAQVLESCGFVRRRGRMRRRSDLPMDVDLLTDFNGSRTRAVAVDTPYGGVRVAGVEDLLIKRLVELKHWAPKPPWRTEILRQIETLLRLYGAALDEGYLRDRAHRERVTDVLGAFRARA